MLQNFNCEDVAVRFAVTSFLFLLQLLTQN